MTFSVGGQHYWGHLRDVYEMCSLPDGKGKQDSAYQDSRNLPTLPAHATPSVGLKGLWF